MNKTRTQIGTNVSQRTRQQVNELIAQAGYSLRDIVTIAIDRMHRKEIEGMNIYDKFLPSQTVYSVDVDEHGQVISEWSWIRLGQGGLGEDTPLGYIGQNIKDLAGFRKRSWDTDSNHPGS